MPFCAKLCVTGRPQSQTLKTPGLDQKSITIEYLVDYHRRLKKPENIHIFKKLEGENLEMFLLQKESKQLIDNQHSC